MKFEELKKSLKSGDVGCIYLLVGEDSRVVEKARDILLSLVDGLPELNVTTFDETADMREVENCCRSFPLMSERRAVVVRDYKGSLEAMDGYFSNPQQSTLLIFTASSLTSNFSKFVKKTTVVECGKLSKNILVPYIAKHAAANGVQVTRPAAELLIDYTLSDLASIENELDKLCSLTDTIKEEDVKNNVTPDADYKIYELGDAICKKQGERAMKIMSSLLADGFAPGALFGMLENHYRRLLYVVLNKDDDNLAYKLGVKEGAVYMALKASAGMKATALKRTYDLIASGEQSFKNGETTDKEAIRSVVLAALNS